MKEQAYINRELSWLQFNQRVLDEAMDASNPLLERLKFLAITASNLDEFFMVRVGGLQMLAASGSRKRDLAGLTADEQLEAISERAHAMVQAQYETYRQALSPALAEAGIRCLHLNDLNDKQSRRLEQLIAETILPTATPMAVSRDAEFPLLANLGLNLLVMLMPEGAADGEPRFAVIPLGGSLPRFLTVPSDGGLAILLIEDVVTAAVAQFFPGADVLACVPFRITRNADIQLQEDMASDLLSEMTNILDERKQSTCVRLELAADADPRVSDFLQDKLSIGARDLYTIRGPLDLSTFMRLAVTGGHEDLKFPEWPPQPSPEVDPRQSMFETLSSHDVLLAHPFDSFDPVIRFLDEAADDPDVIAIKQVLYRTSRESPVVAALRRAAEQGKSVTAVIELRARFDEARNIEWARDLERAGVQVIYGVKGHKIHAKVCLVVRREPHGIRRYVHFGTGNYNEVTAKLYTDISYLSSRDDLGADATTFFNAVNGYSQSHAFRSIAMAPIGIRRRLMELIEGEIQRKRQGQEAGIEAKFNSLADPALIDAFYRASQAGVRVALNIRGICCLRPGVPDLSEHISVVSIVDRFLEHSRIFSFHHGGERQMLISSADLMPRNLDKRLELLVPVEAPQCQARLMRILEACLGDAVKGRHILEDGAYARPAEEAGGRRSSQQVLYDEARQALKRASMSKRLVFEPHRAPTD